MTGMQIEIDDHTKVVLEALGKKKETALKAVGMECESYAKKDCPVDTGRLRNSIAWAIKGKHQKDDNPDSTPKAEPEADCVYIGSNVEYAVYQEYGDYNHKVGKKHFLRDAATTHGDHYKAIIEAALKS